MKYIYLMMVKNRIFGQHYLFQNDLEQGEIISKLVLLLHADPLHRKATTQRQPATRNRQDESPRERQIESFPHDAQVFLRNHGSEIHGSLIDDPLDINARHAGNLLFKYVREDGLANTNRERGAQAVTEGD